MRVSDCDLPVPEELAAAYRRDGVVRVPRLLSQETVAELRRALDRYVRDVLPALPENDVVLEADGVSVRNLWRMEHHDPYFAALGRSDAILRTVRTLVGGEPVLCAVETFNKPARHGSGVPQHQDNAYFCQEPPDLCTVWVAVDPAIAENGPVQYARGSWQVIHPHRASGVPGNSMVMSEVRHYPAEQVTTAILDPGDAMIHHCQTVHWSTPNHTDQNRCGLLLVYRAAHTAVDARLRGSYTEATAAFAAGQRG